MTGKFVPDDVDFPLNRETWEEYLQMTGAYGMQGYHAATTVTVTAMNNILTISKDFAELKSNLLEFIKDQKEFLSSADPNRWLLSEDENVVKYQNFLKNDGLCP